MWLTRDEHGHCTVLGFDVARMLSHSASPHGFARLQHMEQLLSIPDELVFRSLGDENALTPERLVRNVTGVQQRPTRLRALVDYALNVHVHPSIREVHREQGSLAAIAASGWEAANRLATSGTNSLYGIERRAAFSELAHYWSELMPALEASFPQPSAPRDDEYSRLKRRR
jgi:hypothetical protein